RFRLEDRTPRFPSEDCRPTVAPPRDGRSNRWARDSRLPEETLGGLHEGLGERRMRVDGQREILGEQRRLDGERAFRDQLARAGHVADRVDRGVGRAAPLVDGDDAARVDADFRVLEAEPLRRRAPADGNEDTIEAFRALALERGLDAATRLAERSDFRAEMDR